MSPVLIVEDERSLRDGLTRALTLTGLEPHPVASLHEARRALRRRAFGAILLDLRLPDGEGLDLLRELKGGLAPETPVIVVTAYGDSHHTIEAMREGAFDYVTKPFDLPKLLALVQRACRPVEEVAPEPAPSGRLIGRSAAMQEVWKTLGRAAASDAPVLITGETGTGKELVAQEIHEWSARRARPFVAVNLAALPEGLLEAELFGHERGAFTGADRARTGRIERAQGGTLLLDEIGDLAGPLQTRLLRFLQDGGFERLGSDTPRRSDARILAATHKPVHPAEPESTLRADLYYRLAVIEIRLPPLRERTEDIPALVQHALADAPARTLSQAALERLQAWPWPGNVRELLHVVRRSAILAAGDVIQEEDLPEALRTEAPGSPPRPELEDLDLHAALAATERRVILRALEVAGGNRSKAARLLGITRPRLYARMAKQGLD